MVWLLGRVRRKWDRDTESASETVLALVVPSTPQQPGLWHSLEQKQGTEVRNMPLTPGGFSKQSIKERPCPCVHCGPLRMPFSQSESETSHPLSTGPAPSESSVACLY